MGRDIHALPNNASALDCYLWLAYRLHVLHGPKLVTWLALKAQHVAEVLAFEKAFYRKQKVGRQAAWQVQQQITLRHRTADVHLPTTDGRELQTDLLDEIGAHACVVLFNGGLREALDRLDGPILNRDGD